MALYTQGKEKRHFEPVPAGVYIGRCVRVLDLGTQEPKNRDHKPTHRVWLMWEIPSVRREWQDEDGNTQTGPGAISQDYNLSHNEKANLRKMLEGWYGKRFDDKELNRLGGFDIKKVLDRPAQIQVVHTADGQYANVGAIMPVIEGATVPPRESDLVYLELTDDGYDAEVYENLSAGMKEWIARSPEWQYVSGAMEAHNQDMKVDESGGMAPADDGDVPF